MVADQAPGAALLARLGAGSAVMLLMGAIAPDDYGISRSSPQPGHDLVVAADMNLSLNNRSGPDAARGGQPPAVTCSHTLKTTSP